MKTIEEVHQSFCDDCKTVCRISDSLNEKINKILSYQKYCPDCMEEVNDYAHGVRVLGGHHTFLHT